MATTVQAPPKGAPSAERSRSGRSNSGSGGGSYAGPGQGNLRAVQEFSPAPSKTGIWVLLAGIAMMFAAFTSALVVRQGAAMDWEHLALPPILFFNTIILLASSVTLELARRRIAVFMGCHETADQRPVLWLYVTLSLGLIFVAGQYAAWLELRSEGYYLATNPNSSFFYLLTAIHAIHVLGGLTGLSRVIWKLNRVNLRRSTLESFSYYWHFMAVLWLYLLWLLWMRL
ncbi:MAG: cytochrome c oxidase subunit 3 [Acidobacteria bacterium]|nr:cytochrome c oxidase subunit 3 [Acidobacteriota bacterium]MBV9624082.1 cytochrome c oxidase subunit 3 [Acidobacteriota bacterium]